MAMKVRSYRELIAWQKAMDFVGLVYDAAKKFPREELYCLSAQIRKAAVSIPSNIAEGQGRQSTAEFLNFLSIAHGSLCEVETQTLLDQRFGYIDEAETSQVLNLGSEVGRLINGLANSLRAVNSGQ